MAECSCSPTRTGTADAWSTRRRQGAQDHQGEPYTPLTDIPGERPIYALPEGAARATAASAAHSRCMAAPFSSTSATSCSTSTGCTGYCPCSAAAANQSGFTIPPLARATASSIRWWRAGSTASASATGQGGAAHAALRALGVITGLSRDRCYVTADFPQVAQRALKPKLRRTLLGLRPERAPIAYLSRHRLSSGTTCFEGEQEVVEALTKLSNVDVICPEDLGFEQKLGLYRRYRVVTGFVQAAMLLKYFVPTRHPGDLAKQYLFTAGRHSLNSNWVNLERAYGFGDQLLDCSDPTTNILAAPASVQSPPDIGTLGSEAGFQRQYRFHTQLVIDQLRALAAR